MPGGSAGGPMQKGFENSHIFAAVYGINGHPDLEHLYFMTYTSRSYYSIYGIVYIVDQVHSTAPGGSATGHITCTVSYKLFIV